MDLNAFCKPCLYGEVYVSNSKDHDKNNDIPSTLLNLAARKIAKDSHSTARAIKEVPRDLCVNIMEAALSLSNDRAVDVLIAAWPGNSFHLKRFAPNIFNDPCLRYDKDELKRRVNQAIRYTTCVVHTFIESIKNRKPTQLRHLDITGFPAAEVICNYLASHTLLAFNENRQKEIIEIYNRVANQLPETQRAHYEVSDTLPCNAYSVELDLQLSSEDAHLEVCKALRLSNDANSSFQLRPHLVDITSLGVPRINVLLELCTPQFVRAVSLQMNSISPAGLHLLQRPLSKLTNLRALDLSLNSLDFFVDASACACLTLVLSNLPHLRRLDLGGNRIKSTLDRILSPLAQGLEFLGLSGCTVTEDDLQFLQRSPHASTLCELDLSDNLLHPPRFHQLLALLSCVTPSLRVLELEHCHLSALSLASLCALLPAMSRLQYLNLKHNELSTGLTHALVKSLTDAEHFRMLKMHLPDDVVVAEDFEGDVEQLCAAFRVALQLHVRKVCGEKPREPFSVWVFARV